MVGVVLTDTNESGVKIGEHYENYDFGENGIYQNILFKRYQEQINTIFYHSMT